MNDGPSSLYGRLALLNMMTVNEGYANGVVLGIMKGFPARIFLTRCGWPTHDAGPQCEVQHGEQVHRVGHEGEGARQPAVHQPARPLQHHASSSQEQRSYQGHRKGVAK